MVGCIIVNNFMIAKWLTPTRRPESHAGKSAPLRSTWRITSVPITRATMVVTTSHLSRSRCRAHKAREQSHAANGHHSIRPIPHAIGWHARLLPLGSSLRVLRRLFCAPSPGCPRVYPRSAPIVPSRVWPTWPAHRAAPVI